MSGFKQSLRRAAASVLVRSPLMKSYQEKGPPWRILMYHRVVDPERLPTRIQPGMYVRPRTFREQMRYLKENCNVVSINELVNYFAMNEPVPKGTVCVTFDDGWVDNYENAFPALREFEIPATIYLITGYVGTEEVFWVDKLALSLSQSQIKRNHDLDLAFLQSLERIIDGNTYQALYEAYASTAREDETALLDKLATIFVHVPPAPRAQLLSRLFRIIPPRLLNSFPRSFLNWDEVGEMASEGILFGSHTHTNQFLTELDAPQINSELKASYEALRTHGLQPAEAFCYPNGFYNSQSQKCLTDNGIRYALLPTDTTDSSKAPVLLGRVPIHEDVSSTMPLFVARIWANGLF